MLVLLTDGEDHGEEMKALRSRLQAAGVKTHLVAVGSDLGEPVPDGACSGYLRDRQGAPWWQVQTVTGSGDAEGVGRHVV